jgi:hypothetical protein
MECLAVWPPPRRRRRRGPTELAVHLRGEVLWRLATWRGVGRGGPGLERAGGTDRSPILRRSRPPLPAWPGRWKVAARSSPLPLRSSVPGWGIRGGEGVDRGQRRGGLSARPDRASARARPHKEGEQGLRPGLSEGCGPRWPGGTRSAGGPARMKEGDHAATALASGRRMIHGSIRHGAGRPPHRDGRSFERNSARPVSVVPRLVGAGIALVSGVGQLLDGLVGAAHPDRRGPPPRAMQNRGADPLMPPPPFSRGLLDGGA